LLIEPGLDLEQVGLMIGGTILVIVAAAAFPALRAAHAEIEELL
jgi:hypothetical protein